MLDTAEEFSGPFNRDENYPFRIRMTEMPARNGTLIQRC
jgi:hypothetical protein